MTTIASIWEQLDIDDGKDYINNINTQGRQTDKLEKDLYLTALLNQLAVLERGYIFKGGTCLNKCHFGYYRLSEDLDFSLIVGDANRTHRSVSIQMFFDDVTRICQGLGLTCVDQHKRDTNHFGGMKRQYQSVITQTPQLIIFDVKTYPALLCDPVHLPIRDIYTDPLLGTDMFPKHHITCMSLEESMAEKMRAALTRTIPAIRDFYDIRYARGQGFDFETIRDFIRFKVAEVGGNITISSNEAQKQLRRQITIDLQPVVFALGDFDLDEQYAFVMSFVK